MPRIARIVVPGCPHHVTQRGNNHQDVFFTDDDRRLYLGILREQARRHGLALLGYCLMTNHVHLIVVPATESSLAKAIGRTNWAYTQAINRLHGRSGHLWQNRFYSCALDDDHLWTALRYVENNPVRARVVRRPWTYPWSSAPSHVKAERGGDDLLDLAEWRRVFTPTEWRETLLAATTEEDSERWDRLRFHTGRGRPLGSDRFIAKLETALNKRLRASRPGRQPASPRKR